ncbi:MAG: hypothetical protein KAH86_06135 [Methanosarcinales archaeon]|nr:hypothetical protein [Methanosarcinales archaeon]
MDDIQKEDGDNMSKKIANIAIIIMLLSLVFIALFSFFFNMQTAISDLFSPRYQALMQALFSLVTLGVGVFLIKMLFSK